MGRYEQKKQLPDGFKFNPKIINFIKEILIGLYPKNYKEINVPPCEKIIGFVNIFPLKDDENKWSILNFLSSNQKILTKMYNKFFWEDSNLDKFAVESFISWMGDNKETLFGESEFAEEMRNDVFKTVESGFKLEKDTIERLVQCYEISRDRLMFFCKGSDKDIKDGIDFLVDGRHGFQIKRLLEYKILDYETGKCQIKTVGMKDYTNPRLRYMVFSNDDEVLIFEKKCGEQNCHKVVSRENNIYILQYDKGPLRRCKKQGDDLPWTS